MRETNGLTLAQVAERLGYKSSVGYWYIENGLRQAKAEHVAALAQLFSVSIEELFYSKVTDSATSFEPGESNEWR